MSLLVISVSAADVYEIEADTDIVYSVEPDVSVMSYSTSVLSTEEATLDDVLGQLQIIGDDTWSIVDYMSGAEDSLLSVIAGHTAGIINYLFDPEDGYTYNLNEMLGLIYSELSDSNAYDFSILGSFDPDSDLTIHSLLSYQLSELESIWQRQGTIINESRDQASAITSSVYDVSAWVQNLYSAFMTSAGNMFLEWDGDLVETTVSTSFSDLTRAGFAGLASRLEDYMTLTSPELYLDSSGDVYAGTTSTHFDMSELVNNGFVGLDRSLDSLLRGNMGSSYLNQNGVITSSTSFYNLPFLLSNSFLGVRSLIAGSAADNTYSGTVTSNENVESTVTATGLGPMLNQWLDAIQADTGRLAYMFASPEDLEAKKESQSTTSAITDGFLKSDSKASVSLDSVGSIKDASSSIQDLGDTGVDPGLAFEQLSGNSDLFAFFSEETANDLDTTSSTFSRDAGTQIVTDYYNQSRIEFYDLIGKGGTE